MNALTIDKEFKELIPPLSDEEFKQLEENILRDGIQDPLKVWNGILIDGHNRYKIAAKHDLPFSTTEINFNNRNDAIIWIIKNQFGRRNLSAYDRAILALKLKPVIAAKAKENSLANLKQNQIENSDTQIFGGRENISESETPEITTPFEVPFSTELPKPVKTPKHAQETNQQIAQMAGLSHETIRKVEKVEQSATPEIKQALKSGDMSINTAYKEVKKAERKEEIKKQVEEIEQNAIENPDGLFDVIVIDPPWAYGDGHLYHVDGWRVSAPYPEMSQEDLKAIELPAAENCVLCIWTTNQFIWDAKELMDAWGFKYRFMFIWNKQQMGIGRRIRMQCEFCLVGLKGDPVFKDVHNIRDIIEEPRREHSRKPEKFYEIIDAMFAGRKLDYFSREQREGWATYGNDTSKFNLA